LTVPFNHIDEHCAPPLDKARPPAAVPFKRLGRAETRVALCLPTAGPMVRIPFPPALRFSELQFDGEKFCPMPCIRQHLNWIERHRGHGFLGRERGNQLWETYDIEDAPEIVGERGQAELGVRVSQTADFRRPPLSNPERCRSGVRVTDRCSPQRNRSMARRYRGVTHEMLRPRRRRAHHLYGWPACSSRKAGDFYSLNCAARHLTAAGTPSVATISRNFVPNSVLVA